MKKVLSMILCLCILVPCLAACGGVHRDAEEDTVVFTDSAGREVSVPADITRVAPTGAVASMFLASVCPEYMVCVNTAPTDDQMKYLDPALAALPAAGQLFGSRGNMNLEALMSAGPQVIIDFGDTRNGIGGDLDSLQERTGIPVVFIESDLANMAEAFRMLGRLIPSRQERCETLAQYVKETVSLAVNTAKRIPEDQRLSVMYTTGASGLNTNAAGSSQAQIIELIGAANAVVVDDINGKDGGNLINMEQLFLFDPDVILFSPGSMYSAAAEDESWSKLSAVENGRYFEIPASPYNWMSNPPSMNMLLGIRWLGKLLYPEYYDIDIVSETRRAYALLWGYELSDEEIAALLSGSFMKS